MIRRFLFCQLFFALAPWAQAVSYPTRLPESCNSIYPFYLIGQLFFKSGPTDYIGSATIIGFRSLLTAGHNVYDPDTGFSTNLDFYRNTYGPDHTFPVQTASRRLLFSGYQNAAVRFGPDSVYTFAQDAAGLVYTTNLTPHQRAHITADRSLLKQRYLKLAVGYGAEGVHDGDYPLFAYPTTPFFQTFGNFYEDESIYIEGGMSGGPLIVHDSRGYEIMGIVVSGSTRPVAGGVRLIDSKLVKFIRTYLP